ncbi:uncharacterized protein LOC124807002 [Hydra vulgaris]|uniref:uncharacterized protein LOC124807002 n=1 Tax=Hydra vulgaris TaxID=6087 RepID=UPI001F5F82B9|nr:uncharacterized protein LOC124807002 [Hydra vulgaris]
MSIAKGLLNDINDDPDLIKNVITGDESWIYGHDIETKAQLTQWNSPGEPRPKKLAKFNQMSKFCSLFFFDYHGVVHQEFLPYGCTVNKQYYLEVMRQLREAIRRKRPELWKNNSRLLHYDNAHSFLLVRDFLAKNNTTIMPQPIT